MKNNEISSKSPKNKFFADITFENPISSIGSCASVGAMTLEDVKHAVKFYSNQSNGKCFISIRENKADYPSFKWEVVEKYEI